MTLRITTKPKIKMMYKVIAYNRHSLGGYQEFFYKTEKQAKDKRVDLLVRLPEDYVVEIKIED